MLNHLILALLACCIFAPVQAAESAPTAKVETIDLTRDGAYTSGAWTYRIRVYNPGTRSQATVGTLARDGKDVPGTADGKPVETPWGMMTWNGMRGTLETGGKLWGDFGWQVMPKTDKRTKSEIQVQDDPKGLIKDGAVAE